MIAMDFRKDCLGVVVLLVAESSGFIVSFFGHSHCHASEFLGGRFVAFGGNNIIWSAVEAFQWQVCCSWWQIHHVLVTGSIVWAVVVSFGWHFFTGGGIMKCEFMFYMKPCHMYTSITYVILVIRRDWRRFHLLLFVVRCGACVTVLYLKLIFTIGLCNCVKYNIFVRFLLLLLL